MLKDLFIRVAALLVMLSVAMYGQVFAELKALEIFHYLASYSDPHPSQGAHAKSHTHKHRHAPDEPEHEHTTADIGLIATAALAIHSPSSSVVRLDILPHLEVKSVSDEFVPLGWVLSSPFRPPIASS